MNMVDVRDVAQAHIRAMTMPEVQRVIVCRQFFHLHSGARKTLRTIHGGPVVGRHHEADECRAEEKECVHCVFVMYSKYTS